MDIKYNEERDFLDELTDEIIEGACNCPDCLKKILFRAYEAGIEDGEDGLLEELEEEFGVEVTFDEDGEIDKVLVYEEIEEDEECNCCDCGCCEE